MTCSVWISCWLGLLFALIYWWKLIKRSLLWILVLVLIIWGLSSELCFDKACAINIVIESELGQEVNIYFTTIRIWAILWRFNFTIFVSFFPNFPSLIFFFFFLLLYAKLTDYTSYMKILHSNPTSPVASFWEFWIWILFISFICN